MTRHPTALGNGVFLLLGPGMEAGVGPAALLLLVDPVGGWPIAVRVAGAALIGIGLATLVAVFARFVADGAGTPSPAAPTRRLIVRGPYRHVRHPMYVATAAVIAGEGLAFGQPLLPLAAAVYLATLATLATRREEPLLAERFGPEYEAYRRAVPGWVPRWRPWTPG